MAITHILGTCLVATVVLVLAVSVDAEPANVARGCRVTFDTPPNYPLCTDEDDARQITDGQHCDETTSLWAQKPAVGWSGMSPFVFTIDLGKTQSIGGASYSTAAGTAGVGWPSSVLVFTSEDNKSWRLAGDLVRLAARNGLPSPDVYSVFRYVSHDLRTHGRYVKIAIITGTGFYAFTDEVEIYAAPESVPSPPPDEPVIADVKDYIARTITLRGAVGRLITDLASARKAVEGADLTGSDKSELLTRLADAEEEISRTPTPDEGAYRAVLPLNETHARILSVHAPVMRARGLPEFFAWKKHRYDPVSPTEVPEVRPNAPKLAIEMMGNERRADALLLTNASDELVAARLTVHGLPGSPKPPWLKVSSIPWTDTAGRVAMAAALPDAEFASGTFSASIPAGMTRKIWFEVDSSKLEPGRYSGSVSVEIPGRSIAVPFDVRVSAVKMRRPRLSVAVWDYTDSTAYGIGDSNRASCIELMRSHYVDSPWAGSKSMPLPNEGDFAADGRLVASLDFGVFDRWVKLWPDARTYFVFLGVGDSFAGAKMGSPAFDARVGGWAKAVSQHMRQLGLEPSQLALLLVDEPYSDAQDEIIVAWARAIGASAPEITIFEDPVWDRPDLTKHQEAITLADILCPGLGTFSSAPQEVRDYFARLQAQGAKLWFYQCDGPVKPLDPHRYYRMQAWYAFRYGAAGVAWWAFGDLGGTTSSWNEYAAASAPCCPAFIDPDGATDGIHWQAAMEGVEDYEYLAMLKDAAAGSKDATFRAEAERLISEVFERMTPGYKKPYTWSDGVDRGLADRYRLRVLSLMEQLPAP